MRRTAAVIVCGAALAGGCGGSGDRPTLLVAAASSLRPALTAYGAGFAPALVRASFAGSDRLGAQIRAGARPDVLAAANTQLPATLHAAGLVGRPVPFARNRLVLAVPAHGARVRSPGRPARPGGTPVRGPLAVPGRAHPPPPPP